MNDLHHARTRSDVNVFAVSMDLFGPPGHFKPSDRQMDRHEGRHVQSREAAFERASGHTADSHVASAYRRTFKMNDSPLCRVSRLCQGIMPLAGSVVAFVLLIGAAMLAVGPV